jgi:hypothetical protein
MPHELNFVAGWCLVLAAFVCGAVIGLRFHREDYLGGYGSFRRRLLRLGHVALAALGLVNVVYGLSPAHDRTQLGDWPALLLFSGAVAMPSICFLAAWRQSFRHLFFLPVTLLTVAIALIIYEVQP